MWITKTRIYYQSTHSKQAHQEKLSHWDQAALPLWSSFGGMSIPKVSTDHQGFAGTITHMDGMTQKRRQREIEFMYIKCNTSTNMENMWWRKQQQEWEQSWRWLVKFQQGQCRLWYSENGAEIQSCILGQVDKIRSSTSEQNFRNFCIHLKMTCVTCRMRAVPYTFF